MYDLLKFTWENGGIGIYTHLERTVPDREMGSSEYAEHLKELVLKEINLLSEGKSDLMRGEVRDYAAKRMKERVGQHTGVVLFVDELEQHYRGKLIQKVVTDDNSPMREIIARVNRGDAGFYLVLAFAPVSFTNSAKEKLKLADFFP